jgi:hypothetical protein
VEWSEGMLAVKKQGVRKGVLFIFLPIASSAESESRVMPLCDNIMYKAAVKQRQARNWKAQRCIGRTALRKEQFNFKGDGPWAGPSRSTMEWNQSPSRTSVYINV